jgi:hypothetical protein
MTRRLFLRWLPWAALVPGLARDGSRLPPARAVVEAIRVVPYRWPTDVGWVAWVDDGLGRAVGHVDWAGRIVSH